MTAAGFDDLVPAAETLSISKQTRKIDNCIGNYFINSSDKIHQNKTQDVLRLSLQLWIFTLRLQTFASHKSYLGITVYVAVATIGACSCAVTRVCVLTCRQSWGSGCDPPAQRGRGGLGSALCQNHFQVHEGPDDLRGEENLTGWVGAPKDWSVRGVIELSISRNQVDKNVTCALK